MRATGDGARSGGVGGAAVAESGVRYASATGRWVLVASILGSALAGIDATVVNVALPAIGRDLGADLAGLQWTVTAYTLTLAALILLGGTLGDRYGRRRVFMVGVAWFAVASLLCGLAPTTGFLVAARALQGVGGALLTPGSLAMIQATFAPQDRSRAIGAWSGLGGVATAVGPFLGGWLLEVASWRWVFWINLPVAVLVLLLARRHVPESRDAGAVGRVDLPGAALGALGLAGVAYALIEGAARGPTALPVVAAALLGAAALAAFVLVERTVRAPMVPLSVFASPVFRGANAVTFLVYGAFGGLFFLLVLQLQVVAGFSPLAAGTATLPLTVLMLALSAGSGALADRIGPRLPMTAGPLLCAGAALLMLRIGRGPLPPRRAAGRAGARAGSGAAGGPADGDRARRRRQRARRGGVRGEQRRRPGRWTAGRRRAAHRRGPGRRRLCRPHGLRRGLPAGPAGLRRAARRRRRPRRPHHPRQRRGRRPPGGGAAAAALRRRRTPARRRCADAPRSHGGLRGGPERLSRVAA